MDSATKHSDYIARAVELGQTAIAFTEHGHIYQWVEKKMACEKAGLKYLHGCEVYLTEALLLPPDAKEVQKQVMEEIAQRERETEALTKRLLTEMEKADYREEPDPGSIPQEDPAISDNFAERRFAELLEAGMH